MYFGYEEIKSELEKGELFGYAGLTDRSYDYYTIKDGVLKGVYSCNADYHDLSFEDTYKMLAGMLWYKV